jgi:hypothetical protein
MDIGAQVKERRDEILQLTARHGAQNVRVFGSVARGQASDESDVDFLVDLEPGRSLLDRIALIQDLEDLLGRKVDVVTDKTLHWYVRDRINGEAVAL